jgi:hypothetical protein
MSESAECRYLFNTARFLSQQGDFSTVAVEDEGFRGKICWSRVNQAGYSPLRAPFGGPDCQGFWSGSAAARLVACLVDELQVAKIQTFYLTQPPDAYDQEGNYAFFRLLPEAGFELSHQDLNFHLVVNQPFRRHLHRSERWKLNKLIRHGFEFQRQQHIRWDEVYAFFLESRRRKGFELSMNRESLEKVFELFPGQYALFSVVKENVTAAMAITIEVSPDIWYIFYTADNLIFRKFSPVVMLHAGIYNLALDHKIKILDLGTSSLKGIVNSGVATFKRSLGGVASLKNTWVWRPGASQKSS